jgi:hypothetical protein
MLQFDIKTDEERDSCGDLGGALSKIFGVRI